MKSRLKDKTVIYIAIKDRPRCVVPGCKNARQLLGSYNAEGEPYFRKMCSQHHNAAVAKKHGVKTIIEVIAKKVGMTVTEYTNSIHKYRKYRKDYCENRDGRLGFKCNYKIRHPGQLQVDHKDGNHNNNDPANIQTFCCNCHAYKTYINEDHTKWRAAK